MARSKVPSRRGRFDSRPYPAEALPEGWGADGARRPRMATFLAGSCWLTAWPAGSPIIGEKA
jgi:hypothetical protein